MGEALLSGLTPLQRRQMLQALKACDVKARPSDDFSVGRVPRQGHSPLSYAQQRLWFLAQLDRASTAYHISDGLRLRGTLDSRALRAALDRIVLRHEALRTVFVFTAEQAVQRIVVAEQSRFELIEHDLRLRSDMQAELERLGAQEAGCPFDLSVGPLIRGRLIRISEDEHVLLITMHHIVSDGWSMGIFWNELSALYSAFLAGGEDPLPELEIQYADYAVWQRQWIEGEILQQQAGYWKSALAGVPALLELPADHPRPAQQDFGGAFAELVLDERLTSGLKQLSRRHGTTLYMTLLAAWAALLSRLSGQQDIVIGSPVANRGRAEIENLIGFFVNTLALRLDLSGAPSVVDLLGRAKAQAIAAQQHQDIPFEQVVELLQPVRSLSHSPLFQILFAWQNAEEGSLALPGLEVLPLQDSLHRMAKFDLELSLQEAGDMIAGGVEYATSLFEPPTMQRYLGYFRNLLEAMVADDTQLVDRLPILGDAERHRVLYEWNETKVEFPSDKCVHQLFEEQVAKTPDAVAVVYEDHHLSYGELNRKANQMAHYLRHLGVRPDDRVAICVERSLEMIVALLAVLKAGGAYVPLDPAYPVERLRFMLQDSTPVALLTQKHLKQLFAGWGKQQNVLDLNDEHAPWLELSQNNPDLHSMGLTSSHLAYIIYTSGSTGTPKGVMVQHNGVSNTLLYTARMVGIRSDDVIAAIASSAFDISVLEMLTAWLGGAQTLLVSKAAVLDMEQLSARLRTTTVLHSIPILIAQIADSMQSHDWNRVCLRMLMTGGDFVSRLVLEKLQTVLPDGDIRVLYGPTEASMICTTTERLNGQSVHQNPSIGRPIANMRVYILDAHGEPVPVGVAGELYIGGVGVARGYLNRPDLTAERFVEDPFVAESGGRMYRTGDLGRWLPDGNIEFVGRDDFQVKIRGFRIELGEIEARLREHAGVREAVVVAGEDGDGGKRLVAYYTTLDEREEGVGAEPLRSHLSACLPEYMVPAAYVRLEAMPLTPNGKLDRKALPAPDADAYSKRIYEAPQGEIETRLAEIWAEVLKQDKIGRHDNFFELGGHSLLAVTLIERMRRNGLKVDVRTLFAIPTLAALAASVDTGTSAVQVPPNLIPSGCEAVLPEMLPLIALTAGEIEGIVSAVPGGAANVQDIYPLAPLQEGILFHHLMETEGDPYLLAGLVSFDTRARLDSYIGAIRFVIDRHDILRTAVLWEGLPEPVQVVWRQAFLEVEEVEVAGDDASQQLYARFDPRHFRIDVRRAPLFRMYVTYDRENDRWLLLQLLHHLAGDHTTLEVLQAEVQAYLLGQAEQLPAPLPFRNLVAQARQGISREEHEAFFRKMLGDVDEPTAPFGLLDVHGDGTEIEEAHLELDNELARRLRAQARRMGVSAASLCHLAWAQVLAKVSGREDVVFGTVLFGRMQGSEGSDRVMGLFINTLPVRISIDEEGAEAGVRRTHALLADLLRHEHASLVLAQRCSAVPAPAPLFSALLNYRHIPAQMSETSHVWQGIQGIRGQERTNYPFGLSVNDLGEGFSLDAQTHASVDPVRICEFMRTALVSLSDALETAPSTPLRRLEVLPAPERHRVLYEWNETKVEFPSDKCVHQLFEEQVAKTPDAVAVVYEDHHLSYGELNRKANQMAHYLRHLGVRPDDRVAIALERSVALIAAELAILKCGASYVPIDPNFPEQRKAFCLSDCAAKVLLFSDEVAVPHSHSVVTLNVDHETWGTEPFDNLQVSVDCESVAYVMYTSGSTGRAKGVTVPHPAIGRLVLNNGYAQVGETDRVAFASNPTFDASTLEVWAPLLNGGCVVIINQDVLLDPRRFGHALKQYGITLLWLTAGLFNRYSEVLGKELQDLRYLLIGGESLDPEVIARTLRCNPPQHLINGYGPTEATTFAATYEIVVVSANARSIPIGRPIANTRIYILDAYGEPVPVGVAGELYIGGVGVARGYLNRPDLTAERFVEDPFVAESGGRMYRTGDLGRWLPDGNIEFVGRDDFQVKIRGFRIELGEIEARLREHAGVREAVVVAGEDGDGGKRLVAYYTTLDEREEGVGAEPLRSHLSACLPEYMVPAAYVRLEAMPLTPNGKLDRKALPAPDADAYSKRIYEAPQGEIETRLAEIWAEVLKQDKIGRHDNFFELGGHSLLAVTLIERMRRNGLKVDVRTLFAIPTLAALAASVDTGTSAVQVPPNLIPSGCEAVLPEMLPLIALTAGEIEGIVSAVPGGAANVQDIYPLAPLQEGILFHHLMETEGDPYLLVYLFSFDTRARLDSYIGAIRFVIDRHDILRTAVLWEGLPEPVQVVWRQAFLEVEEVEVAGDDASQQLYARFDPRHFRIDVRRAPLFRMYVTYDRENDRWLLLQLLHHLAGDHTTLEVLQAEVQAYLLGQAEQLPAPLPFRNLVAQARQGISREEHEAFFRKMLGDVDEPTAPFGLLDVHGDGTEIEEAHLELDNELARRLRAQARRMGVSAASLCHLAWAQVLAKVSGREDVVFGTVLFGRMQGSEGSDRVMGLFINTLPVRISIDEEGAEAGVRRTHALLADLLRHEHASLVLAQRCSAVPAPAPLFSALLNYRHIPAQMSETSHVWQGIQGIRGQERTNYPFGLSVNDLGEGFSLDAQTHASVDPVRICEFMRTALVSLSDALETAPSTPLRRLEVLPAPERHRVLYEWNETKVEFPSDKCVHQLFEEQVAKTPDAVAVVYEDHHLSYGELNRKANQMAHYLRHLGVRPDDRVAICVERSLEMIVALLAVLKAGGAYVPLDPAYPVERLRFMLQDSTPVALLTQKHLKQLFAGWGKQQNVLDLNDEHAPWLELSQNNPDLHSMGLTSSHLAYIIYTSGSTGTPKGVMVQHSNVARLFGTTEMWFKFAASDIWTLFHSYSFDFSVWEIWGALLYGGRLIVVSNDIARSPDEFYALICREGVTVLNQTPSAFQRLISVQSNSGVLHRLRCVVFGGEALEPAMLKSWYERNCNRDTQLINMYGITETTVHVTYRPLGYEDTKAGGPSPIGCPLPDLRAYILDAYGEPVPVGVAGELYIGGVGVARGYLNRPDLTAERFVEDPFVAESGGRMYRTGDLGRWLPDGNIEFVGRDDFQVKIRGFRIELGEIEARLREHAGVREAVVVAGEDGDGGKRLVAYYTTLDEREEGVGAEPLRSHLSACLPEYMVPAAYVRLEAMPLTPNGKLDRKALPAPDADAYSKRIYEAPQGEIETRLAEIWAEVLKQDKIGRHDNFFELGGHSLLAVTLIERMRRNGLKVDVRTLFAIPTLAALAASVDTGTSAVQVPPNLIPSGCEAVLPEMLPLIALTAGEIEGIVSAVPGGAANVQDIYPLAPLQEGILFHHLMETEGDPYLLAGLVSFDTRARLDSYIGAIRFVIDRHDILRTAVLWEGLPEPVQVVWRQAFLEVEEVEVAGDDASQQLYARFDPRHFRIDVRRAPLFRMYVTYDRENDRWLLLQLLHHLAGDHTTLEVLQAEVQAYLLGQAEQLPAPLPFRNLVAQARQGISREEHEAFFRKMLGDVDEPTAPFGLLDVHGDGTEIEEAHLELDNELARRLRAQARRMGVSAASLCHLAWAQVLAKVSGREDVVFGTVLFGRMQGSEGSDRVMGLFINTLPVRISIDEEGAEAGVRRTHALLADLLRHEHASLVLAQRCSAVPAPAPLFSALLNYRHTPAQMSETSHVWQGIQGIRGQERTNYPFGLSVNDLGEGFSLDAQTHASVDPVRICEFMRTALVSLSDALETAPSTPLRRLEVLPAPERHRVLYEWNETKVEFPSDKCVHQLFEEQVAKTPDAVAVVYEDHHLSYGELNRKANQMAHYLRHLGVRPDDRVAICVERSLEMIVALLAVLKAGGAYVPLDPAYPVERLRFMLQDSTPVALLTQKHLKQLFAGWGKQQNVLDLNDEHAPWLELSQNNPDLHSMGLTSSHLAYIIYTSGSTGTPKGVMVQHNGLVNLVIAQIQNFVVSTDSRVLQFASFGFDACVSETLMALCRGASLHLVRQQVLVGDSLGGACVARRITHITLPPAALLAFPVEAKLNFLETLIVAGDALVGARTSHLTLGRRLINAYGPTEATICATLFQCGIDTLSNPSIGRPIANMRVYILDAYGEPVPVGVAGELYIGGVGVARGYLNRPDLTAERFVEDPFVAESGGRMYRTGDLGRWLPDGNIEFVGRDDFQVKIRGFRIELGEIEARLREHAGVREAVVVAGEDGDGGKRLVAYYTTLDEREEGVGAEPLRSHLSACLPEYMVPAAYVRLEAMPLTPNGKLDRKALPVPDADAYSKRIYEAPQGEIETRLAEIWAEVLKQDKIGRHDNFFELGGHSLLAVRLITRLRQALCVELAIRDLFAHPVLADLARALQSAAGTELPAIGPVQRDAQLPLSYAQQRLWFLAQLDRASTAYHISGGLRLRGTLDSRALRAALDRIVLRHEALRTVFVFTAEQAVQRIVVAEQSRFELIEHDLRLRSDMQAELERLGAQEAGCPFDLSVGPLIRGRLIRISEDEHVLLITMHHIVSDGWSMGIFWNELSALYSAFLAGGEDPLPELEIQYADYAVWQRQWIEGEILQQQAGYWKSALAGVPALLELPADHPRPAQQDFGGAFAELVLDERLTSGLKQLSRRHGTTLYMTLLAAWAALLSRLSGQQDIVIGSPVANRGRAEIENLIGFFVNTLALRLDLSGAPSVVDLLGRAKAQAIAAQQHQDIPFEQVVELLQPVRSLSHSPLFQIMFAWQNVRGGSLALPGLEVLPLQDSLHRMAKFDLELSLQEAGDMIAGGVEYATSLFEPPTMQRYLGYFRNLLEAMVADDTQLVDRLPILGDAERHRVLYEWNETKVEFPSDKCVHQLFEEQVAKTPDAVAVVYEDHHLSYGELNRKANQMAHYLRHLGVRPDDRVAICVERSLEMIVALLAVLKAGGAYVPLDPAYPVERLRFMLQDSTPVALLTQKHLKQLFAGWGKQQNVLDLNDEHAPWLELSQNNPDLHSMGLTSSHLAYIIYTSGSTGTPKGVMVQHSNVARLFGTTEMWFKFAASDIWTLFHSYSFDFSVWEIWGALLYGGRLIVVSNDVARSPDEFYALICREGVTVLNQTPSAFQRLISVQSNSGVLHRLRCVVFGGEALEPAMLKSWYERNCNRDTQLINMYGITETTVHVTYRPLGYEDTKAGGPSPIGCPLPDLRAYILDAYGEPVPVGVAGELYIGGVGVARGYLNRPDLTAERFVEDPFVAESGGRMYRTGDLGRWLPDGNIEFVGRDDFQVKIRGFRIELGEIEARLREHAGVREAVVVAGEDGDGGKRLVAYYTTLDEREEGVGAEPLRSHLSACLPEYMVPAAYVRLEAMPLTPNGKLDRKALPAPDADAYSKRTYEAPQGEIETRLAEIWAEVLKQDKIGRHDDFFELGGHSLLAVTLIERMHDNGLKVDVRTLFAIPTLAALAASVDTGTSAVQVPPNLIPSGCEAVLPEMLPLIALTAGEIEGIVSAVPGGAANVQDIYPLAPLQEGILFHHLMETEGDPYLQAYLFSFDTRARLDSYIGAIRFVIDRHDILRTAVLWEGLPEPVQVVWRQAFLEVEEVEVAGDDASQQLYARFDPRHFRIDVRRAPLFRMYVTYDRENDRWLLLQLLHHLMDDNTSFKRMQAEVQAYLLGQAEQLPAPLPFRNLVAQARQGISREEHEAFFRKMLGDVDEPTAPFGLLDVHGDGTEIEEAHLELDNELARRLRAQARRMGVSAASLCHLAWAQVLAKVSGREDVVFGTVLFGRMQGSEGSDRVMGLFINTLPVRISIDEEGAEAGVRRTHALLADLLRHEHASLVLAQRCSAVPAPAPLFSALLNYRHTPAQMSETSHVWQGIQGIRGQERTNYPFGLSVNDLGEGFSLDAQTHASVDPVRICEFMRTALVSLSDALETAPSTPLRRLEVLPAPERHRVLYEWNETKVEFPSDKCVHQLFEEQVVKTPDAVAVVYEDHHLSYGELNRKANQMAHYLRHLGVRPDDRVAICVERSLEMIVALLAVLKAGGAYVPLDPAYPVERLRFMLQDSTPVALLTQKHLKQLFAGWGKQQNVLDLNDEHAPWLELSQNNPDLHSMGLTSSHLAYIIYTSGSTGTPKGVMVQHNGVTNRLHWMQRAIGLDRNDTVLQKTPFDFDVSVWEFLWPILAGAKLAMARPKDHKDPEYLSTTIRRENVTTLHFVPSMLESFLGVADLADISSHLRVICSGEPLSAQHLQSFYERLPDGNLHNLYGPTEATVDVTSWRCSRGSTLSVVPIGRPIANMRIYILDAHGEPVPVGVTGELYIGGVGVARGYLNRPDLTAERFVEDPFVAESGGRMYRTGDLGRWLPDGNIEFVGRDDFQVKIRGFRIELGEIEARLREHAGVREAVVMARDDGDGDKRLVAYYTTSDEHSHPILQALRTEQDGHDLAQKYYQLPNGLAVFHNNESETKFLFEEIFNKEIYLRHGITVQDGDCIFDVGANIGLFTLFLCTRYPHIKIHAFEPIPVISNLLRCNVTHYHLNVDVYECAVTDTCGEAVFTFYPHNSIISTNSTSKSEARSLVKAFLMRSMNYGSGAQQFSAGDLDALLDERLQSEECICQTATISQVIKEKNIDRIDLLKVDVESAELLVLRGIGDTDWKRIKQLVIEVHDTCGRLTAILAMLKDKGYEVSYEQDEALEPSQLYNIYAVRSCKDLSTATSELNTIKTISLWTSRDSLVRDLRSHLSACLPEYMVPAAYVRLEAMPLTSNGKLDRKALPAPDADAYSKRIYEAPQGEIETRLAEIWAEVLKQDKIGRHDNFFELGGHSLLAVRLITRLRQALCVELAIRDLFAHPVLADLARALQSSPGSELPRITRARGQQRSLSVAQRIVTATRLDGHRIASRDNGDSWYDLQTGEAIDVDP